MTEHVCTHDWPVGGRLDVKTVLRVLIEFDRHHPAAVRSLTQAVPADTEPAVPDAQP
jgi:hypothetical protein